MTALGGFGGIPGLELPDIPTEQDSLGMLVSGANRSRRISMMGVDPTDGTPVDWLPEMSLQFWPEQLTDALVVNYTWKALPGATAALATWNNNSGRSFAVEVPLVRLMVPNVIQKAYYGPMGLSANANDPAAIDMNCNIDFMLKYLRAFCYPMPPPDTSASRAVVGGGLDAATPGSAIMDEFSINRPPPLCYLNIPGLHLGEDGSDAIMTVMTGCDITFNKMFEVVADWPNPDTGGSVRVCTVALAFKQVVERPGNAKRPYAWVTSKDLMDTAYRYADAEIFGKLHTPDDSGVALAAVFSNILDGVL